MGHLTRIKTFIQNVKIDQPFKVITSNALAHKFFSPEKLIYITADKETTRSELGSQIKSACSIYSFDQLYVDTFPCGILGELSAKAIACDTCFYLARRMNWQHYAHLVKDPYSFETTYQFEALTPEHSAFVNERSNQVEEFSLIYTAPRTLNHEVLQTEKPIWLIVHTSQIEELLVLIDHAKDIADIEGVHPRYIVLSEIREQLPNDVRVLTDEEPIHWYPIADKIFTAAGFNTWHQLENERSKHVCLPFPRKYDDQFWRVSS